MVENLLSVTRIDSEKVTVQKTPTVLDELLDAVLVKFRKRYPDIQVELETPDAFIVIPMDSMLIQQVLMNLLENAALHAEGMTKLTLKVFTVGNRAVFEVTDNGCGIPRERLKKLFSGTGSTDPDAPAGSVQQFVQHRGGLLHRHLLARPGCTGRQPQAWHGHRLVGVCGHHQGPRRRDQGREPGGRGNHHPLLAGDRRN